MENKSKVRESFLKKQYVRNKENFHKYMISVTNVIDETNNEPKKRLTTKKMKEENLF